MKRCNLLSAVPIQDIDAVRTAGMYVSKVGNRMCFWILGVSPLAVDSSRFIALFVRYLALHMFRRYV